VDGPRGDSARGTAARVAGKHALVCLLTDTIDAAVLDAAGPSLKVVANVAVGYNNIDVEACRARGVVATNTPDVLTNACADFTWALILAVTRRLGEGERVVRAGQWGAGRSTTCSAWSCAASSSASSAWDASARRWPRRRRRSACAWPTPRGRARRCGRAHGARPAAGDLRHRVAALSDDAGDTKHLIDQKALAPHEAHRYLINTARGPVVDEAALAWALRKGGSPAPPSTSTSASRSCIPTCCRSRTCCSSRTWPAPPPRRGRRWPTSRCRTPWRCSPASRAHAGLASPRKAALTPRGRVGGALWRR
jgi:glyoxylate reductase